MQCIFCFFQFIDTVVAFFLFLFVFRITSAAVFRDEDLCDVVQIPGKTHKLLIDTYRRKDYLVSSTSPRCLAETCFPKVSNLDQKTT